MSSLTESCSYRWTSSLSLVAIALLIGAGCSGVFQDDAGLSSDGDATASTSGQEHNGGDDLDEGSMPSADDPELAYIGEIGAVQQAYYGGIEVDVEELDGHFVYEGDIILPKELVRFEQPQLVLEPGEEPESLEEYNKLTARTKAHWPDGVVYYSIDPALPDQQRVTNAIAHWEENTSLSFEPRTTENDYVYFTPGGGCSSYIGRIGGRQNITLASACSTGNTIHEIGHAIGLWHEHSRADRDNHVTINWQNVREGREHNFRTYAEMGFDGDEFTDALDFGSVMMYGSYSFSSNGQPTIVKKDGSTYSIQRDGLSADDIDGIAKLYPSDGGEPEYVNGQYYTIAGLTVLRYNDLWYFRTKYGFKRVELINGRWYWV